MKYRAIKKPRLYVYAHADQIIHKRLRTAEYLKCHVTGCDESAKLAENAFFLEVKENTLL